jgi:hypothetical protein
MMADVTDQDVVVADTGQADHAVLATVIAFLMWPAFLLLAGALARAVDPSFGLGAWVWHGEYVGRLLRALIVAFSIGVIAFGTTNLVFGQSFFHRHGR